MTLLTPAPEQRSPSRRSVPFPPPPADAPVSGDRLPLGTPVRYVAAAASLGAAAIHFSVMPGHWTEWALAGAFFGVVAWLQVAWAVALLQTRSHEVVVLGMLGQLGVVGTWVASRTVGMPFGPHAGQAEEIAFIDVLSTVLSGVAIVGAALLLLPRATGWSLRRPLALGGAGILVLGVMGATTTSLVPSVGGHAHEHGAAALAAGGHGHASTAKGDIPAGWTAGCHHGTELGHGSGSCTDATVTSEQRAAAERLVADTSSRVTAQFPTLAAAEKAGYRVVNETGPLIHVAHPTYQRDNRLLDPERVESMVYAKFGGTSMLLGAMYIAEPTAPNGPLVGGALTSWHIHTNLCVDPVQQTALNPLPNGTCAPGSAIGPTEEMLHVWTLPYDGGPFAEIDPPALIKAVTTELQRRAGAARSS